MAVSDMLAVQPETAFVEAPEGRLLGHVWPYLRLKLGPEHP